MSEENRKEKNQSKDTVFLTRKEAIDAVRLDLKNYPPQPILLRRLAHLVFGDDRIVSEDSRQGGLWVRPAGKRKAVLLHCEALPESILAELGSQSIPLKTLVAVCGCVFQEKARPKTGEGGEAGGVILETGVENFKCRQCGRCCRVLDYHRELTMEDYRLWQELGRKDILKRVKVIRRKAEIVGFRIWMDPATKEILPTCPWLKKDSEHNRYFCLIHDVRPRICRQYPGTRKHARMTGCQGFER